MHHDGNIFFVTTCMQYTRRSFCLLLLHGNIVMRSLVKLADKFVARITKHEREP
jgi:hypothetical protein